MLGTIVTGLVFGSCAVAALAIMKRDHGEAHRARKRAIDEATEPWRALYADKEAELAELRAQYEQTVAALQRELHRADQEIARWNVIATALRGRERMPAKAGNGGRECREGGRDG